MNQKNPIILPQCNMFLEFKRTPGTTVQVTVAESYEKKEGAVIMFWLQGLIITMAMVILGSDGSVI